MKGMPLPFDFEGKGVFLGLDSSQQESQSPFLPPFYSDNHKLFLGCGDNSHQILLSEPNSVLDNISSSPSPTSTSTLSSSFGGGGGGGGGGGRGGSCSTDGGVAAVSGNPPSQKWPPENQETASSNVGVAEVQPFPLEIAAAGGGTATAGPEKCGLGGMEDWESVLSESVAASPGQEQNILRWIMGDVEDPTMGLNKVLQLTGGGVGGGPGDFEFSGGFGVVDQGFGLDSSNPVGANLMNSVNPSSSSSQFGAHKVSSNPQFFVKNPPSQFFPVSQSNLNQSQTIPFEAKPQIFSPQLLINQHQVQTPQNPAFFLPLSYNQAHQDQLMPPQPKRHNPGTLESPKNLFLDPGLIPSQVQFLPPYLQQQQQRSSPQSMVASKKMAMVDELGSNPNPNPNPNQQGIIDQLYKVAELVQSGNNPVLAQGILARLNHQLSPIGKPFYRAAFYFKESLQLLVHSIVNNMNPQTISSATNFSPFSLIFKIGAYKSFSEISPFIQFANFTCNQALLESLDGFDQINIIDFDIGYGGQWASLMQELALRSNGAPSLKITAFASPSTHDQLELGLTRENLIHFANGINVGFEFEIVSLDVLSSSSWSLPFHLSENEAIAVNLPINSFSNYQIPLPLVLRFVKNLSPKIIVSVDRGCDRTDLPFPNHVIHALQSYSNLLESLDAVNTNLDALQKIERFLFQPSIEKIITGRYRFPEKTQHWRNLFLSSGFSPLTLSNFTESQAECVVKRTPVRGFHVEKRQSSLVLCWQRRELVSASAWRC